VKLKYLRDGSPNCPLVRSYEVDQSEARKLRHLAKSLVAGVRQDVALHNEVWVEPIEGCRVNLRQGTRDQGICQARTFPFECVVSPDDWSSVDGLLEPYCASQNSGLQWLTHDGRIALLISRSGQG
jgi:hypothetical protein